MEELRTAALSTYDNNKQADVQQSIVEPDGCAEIPEVAAVNGNNSCTDSSNEPAGEQPSIHIIQSFENESNNTLESTSTSENATNNEKQSELEEQEPNVPPETTETTEEANIETEEQANNTTDCNKAEDESQNDLASSCTSADQPSEESEKEHTATNSTEDQTSAKKDEPEPMETVIAEEEKQEEPTSTEDQNQDSATKDKPIEEPTSTEETLDGSAKDKSSEEPTTTEDGDKPDASTKDESVTEPTSTEDGATKDKPSEDKDKAKTNDDDDDVCLIEENHETVDLCDDNESVESNKKDGQDSEEEDDEDFDPSLLCPEVSMDVEEAPVNTTSDAPPDHDRTSPLLYDSVFSTYVDEMTGCEVSFNLTPEEHAYRTKTYGHFNPIRETQVHCTACNVHLGSALDAQKNRFIHPLLKVLVCRECYNFYASGEFEKDEDGSELYCRWCGQGGQVICCSKCEFVFCKRCIRNNFGRRQVIEINKNDEWKCYRCEMTQISHLRAHAFEFFEYVRNETSRASTLGDSSYLSTDFTKCCIKKKHGAEDGASTSEATAPKRRRRKNSETDPDYDPEKSHISSPVVKVANRISALPGVTVVPPRPNANAIKPIILMPRVGTATPMNSFAYIRPVAGAVRPVLASGIPGLAQTRPLNNQIRHGLIKLTPQTRFVAPRLLRPAAGTRINPVAIQRAATPIRLALKHDWFEKTVRNTAKVNSNLSYTLTQLGKAQQQATTVEALAVVHNKLQEVLSTSINSLIQVRKNLRAEFVAGIRTTKFPAKAGGPAPSTSTATSSAPITIPDDDVVVVPTKSSVEPPPLIMMSPKPTILLPQGPAKTVAAPKNGPAPQGFIKVKPFSALQSANCITIPDDTPAPAVAKKKIAVGVKKIIKISHLPKKDIKAEPGCRCFTKEELDQPSDELKRMFSVNVILNRSESIDKQCADLCNGENDPL